MAIGGSVRELGRFLEACERDDRTVTSVEFCDDADAVAATVELMVGVGTDDSETPVVDSPEFDDAGSLRFGLAAGRELVPVEEFDIEVECLDAGLTEDTLTTTVRVTAQDDREPSHGIEPAAAESEPDVPAFKDPDRLAEVYSECDTFAEMAETIDMDVTAETVRRYMIDYDIHQPNTYHTERTATAEGPSATNDDAAAEPIVLSDGIGLPDDVTIDTLIDTVKRSNTFYEVTREVNVEREDAREMLEQLNLLDLVKGRLATEHERDLSREEIVDRLRDAPGTE
ncbi:MAG: hypothetical protein ABEH64_01915 [Salinirussus sp.]